MVLRRSTKRKSKQRRESQRSWCNRNSKPIIVPLPVIDRGKKINLKRIEVLERLYELAEPRPDVSVDNPYPSEIKKSALTYEPTERIRRLSVPRPSLSPELITALERTSFIVRKSALNHVTTQRERELSQPRRRDLPKPREFWRISRAALNHETTRREHDLHNNTIRPDRKRVNFSTQITLADWGDFTAHKKVG